MSDAVVAGLCRLTIRGPEGGFALAVPVDVPLADLIPAIIGYAGEGLDASGVEHGGWVLQRLGGDPLDEEATPHALGLRDGETLYLRPRHDALPLVHFDDLVDAVATSMRERADTWQPRRARQLLLVLALVALGTGLLLLGHPGPVLLRAGAAGAAGVLLLVGATVAARAGGDATAGTGLGCAAVAYLAFAGYLVPAGGDGPALLGARLLAGCAAAAGAAVLALAAVSVPLFLGLVLAALLAAAGAVATMYGVPLPSAAGLAAVLVVIAGAYVPAMAFRLSGLRLPLLPANAEQLQEGIEPYPSRPVLARSAIADGYMTAMYACAGLLCAGCLTLLTAARDWPAVGLAAALSLLLVLHARGLGGTWHRLAAVVPGAYGAALLAARLGGAAAVLPRVLTAAAVLVAAGGLVVAALTVPGRRMLPYWGRAADIAHTLLAVSLVPLLLALLGVYHALRALNG